MPYYLLFVFASFCALFLNTNLGTSLGFTQITTTAFTPIMLYIGCKLFNKSTQINASYNKPAILILLCSIFIIALKHSIGQDFFKNVLCLLIIPMLISICFEKLSYKETKVLRKIVLLFFIVECSLAIVERITGNLYFNYTDVSEFYTESTYEWMFRSTALLGHPLANAMAVTVIISFILTSDFKIRTKIFYFLLGYIALFCFNARGAILVITICSIPYIVSIINTLPKKKRIYTYVSIFIIGYYLFNLVVNTSLGGRLLNNDVLIDGSAKTRLEVFNFHKFMTHSNLWLGNADNYLFITRKLGAGGVENGVISIILNYGLFMGLAILILLFFFQYKKLSIYSLKDKLYICLIFYIIGTMNPNLASPIQWTIWIFAYYALRPQTRHNRIYK